MWSFGEDVSEMVICRGVASIFSKGGIKCLIIFGNHDWPTKFGIFAMILHIKSYLFSFTYDQEVSGWMNP